MIKKFMEHFQYASRKRKYELFMKKINPSPNDIILDIGGGNGLFLENKYEFRDNIICLDLEIDPLTQTRSKYPEIQCIQADALMLPFKDSTDFIIFSNAVIEHVGSKENQKKFASEISRVAKKFFVTTPYKYFPIEFHYRIPFYQFIPKRIQKWLNEKFSIGLWYYPGVWEDLYLLSYRQFKKLFPGSTVLKQRITFMCETLIGFKD